MEGRERLERGGGVGSLSRAQGNGQEDGVVEHRTPLETHRTEYPRWRGYSGQSIVQVPTTVL
jgi:hypothetical protein